MSEDTGNPIRLLLVDDHEIVRDGIMSMLETRPDMKVVATAASAEEGLTLYRAHRPDVAVVDLRLPGMSGVDLIGTLRTEFPDARFVVLTTFDTDEDIYQAIRAGAQAYLLKDSFRSEIVSAIRAVHEGKRVIPDEIARRLRGSESATRLSPREIEVLRQVARGDSNKIVASALGIGEGTVRTHLQQIYWKLGVDDRTAAVTSAIARGIIRI